MCSMSAVARPASILREKLRHMIDSYRVSQLLCMAAELRIADFLHDGPKNADELAVATRTDPRSLFRVLRALASVDVLERRDDRRYALAPLGEWLRSDAGGSLRPWALLSARMYRAWEKVLDSIRTGEGGLGSGCGERRWQHLEGLPEEARIFHDAMGANTAWVARAVLATYDFSAFASIVDVGGGNGTLIASILGRYPRIHGIVFDLPEAVRDARSLLGAAGLAARCRVCTGSFFDPVPPGGDAYLLSRVLHNWGDDHAVEILRSTRRAMTSGTTLLIIERIVDPESPSVEATLSDLNMLLMNGGCERTTAEFEVLLAASGFSLTRVFATETPVQIFEAVAL
jgi:O-methyltransferase domain/Dimerisation domain